MQADGRNRVTAMEREHQKIVRQLSGGKSGGEPTTSDAQAREFATEDEAKAAKLKPGTRVKIGGVSGTWQ
jgi:hypothetical protein